MCCAVRSNAGTAVVGVAQQRPIEQHAALDNAAMAAAAGELPGGAGDSSSQSALDQRHAERRSLALDVSADGDGTASGAADRGEAGTAPGPAPSSPHAGSKRHTGSAAAPPPGSSPRADEVIVRVHFDDESYKAIALRTSWSGAQVRPQPAAEGPPLDTVASSILTPTAYADPTGV